ncbi:MAG: histidine kinase [Lachnospiraceae bacterium]|nr:histidine kinase [Lachnospiraceae bacterium]
MSKNRESLSVQMKLTIFFFVTSVIVILVNIIMFININNAIDSVNRVYYTNFLINEAKDALDTVQRSMNDYLNTKSTYSIEKYFEAEQTYKDRLTELEGLNNGGDLGVIQSNIIKLSDTYLRYTSRTIQAKRGRVVEKYRQSYDTAEEIYGYINSYIYSLNNERFKQNTRNYTGLMGSFRSLEYITILVLVIMSIFNILVTGLYTKNIMDPVRERQIMMETHLKDAELKYLQAQINPHFLFNTLNAGAQLAMLEDADRTYDYIQNMAAFFRYRIKGADGDTTLAQEIGLVDNYIYILNVRFSGEIHFEKDVDENCTGVVVPGMILQPVVENAVNYGVRNIDREKLIKLSVKRSDGRIEVKVLDNGAGMTARRIEEVMAGTAGEEQIMKDSNGVGLLNVISRMRLYYGTEEVLKIESDGKDKGTTVTLFIPDSNGGDDV